MNLEEAKQILESDTFKEIWKMVEDEYINRIRLRPLEDIEAPLALSVMESIKTSLEQVAFTGKIEEYNTEASRKYQ
jgi:hypothetical protein